MCGIIGIWGKNIDLAKAASIISNRGKDGYGFATEKEVFHTKSKSVFLRELKTIKNNESKNILIHNLHSVVGYEMQPFRSNAANTAVFSANCEIYNWKQINDKCRFMAKNDAEVLFKLLEDYRKKQKTIKNFIKKIPEILEHLDGAFAFCYWIDDYVIAARDYFGEKPLCYGTKGGFYIASENKVFMEQKMTSELLPPNEILIYNLKTKKLKIIKKPGMIIGKEIKDKEKIKHELKKSLVEAVKSRVEDVDKVGVLFSGGVDSTLIAIILKKLKKDFICYTAGFVEKGLKAPEDLEFAERAAKVYGFRLKAKKIGYKETEKAIKEVLRLIETPNPVKVGVALPFYLAAKEAKKDKVKVILSGLGSEELFAGYERHAEVMRKRGDVNKECLKGLKNMWERDLYRDDVVMMANNIELRLPFLRCDLIDLALRIPAKYKITEKQNKIILREAAEELGMKKEFAQRKKRAAQYGSGFDKAIRKLAKKQGKTEYLDKLYKQAL